MIIDSHAHVVVPPERYKYMAELVASRANPFLLTVSFLGGGGYLEIAAASNGLESIEGSLQFGAAPPVQIPAAHASFNVQALPSSHGAVLNAWTQPVARVQESVVHTSPSLQSGAGPPWHEPPAQASAVVHSLLSSLSLLPSLP